MKDVSQKQQTLKQPQYPLKNSISPEWPQYMLANPNTVVRNQQNNQLALAKHVNFKECQPKPKASIKILPNQKFGLSKDTPFSSNYIQYNPHTKALFNTQFIEKQPLPQQYLMQPGLNVKALKQTQESKLFTKIINTSLSVEKQKKVQLLYNKEAQQNLQQYSHYLDQIQKKNEQSMQVNSAGTPYTSNQEPILNVQSPKAQQSRPQTAGMYQQYKGSQASLQKQIMDAQKACPELKGVDQQVMQFYWSMNSKRDDLSKSLIKSIQKEQQNQAGTMNSQPISKCQSFLQQQQIQNPELQESHAQPMSPSLKGQFTSQMTENPGHPYSSISVQYKNNTSRIQSASTNRKITSRTSYQNYKALSTSNFGARRSTQQSLTSGNQSCGASQLQQTSAIDKIMGELEYAIHLRKEYLKTDQRADAKTLMLKSYDHQRLFDSIQEQIAINQTGTIGEIQKQLTSVGGFNESQQKINQLKTKKKLSLDTVIKKGEYNVATLSNRDQNEMKEVALDFIQYQPHHHRTFRSAKQIVRPKSSFVNRNTIKEFKSEGGLVNVGSLFRPETAEGAYATAREVLQQQLGGQSRAGIGNNSSCLTLSDKVQLMRNNSRSRTHQQVNY